MRGRTRNSARKSRGCTILRRRVSTYMRGNSSVDPKLAGGGVLTANGSHSIDLFRWLIGEPTRVQAMAATLGQDLPVEDVGLMHLSMDDRALGEFAVSFSTHFGTYALE